MNHNLMTMKTQKKPDQEEDKTITTADLTVAVDTSICKVKHDLRNLGTF
jgi:hypothetical protein